jgi:hypothetical protein
MKTAQKRYRWTPELHAALRAAWGARKSEHTAALDDLERRTGWSRWVFKHEAYKLGLTGAQRRQWTVAEDKLLMMKAGALPIDAIAKHLGRSRSAIKNRLQRLEMASRVREGFCIADVAHIFGVSRERITRWIAAGLLGSPVPTNNGVRVADSALVHFIRVHHDQFSFRTADEVFLKGVLYGHDREGLSGEVIPCPACRGLKARDRSRRAAGGAAVPIDVGSQRCGAAGSAPGMDRQRHQASAAAAAARIPAIERTGDGGSGRFEHAC